MGRIYPVKYTEVRSPPLVSGSACWMTQPAQSVAQESIKVRPTEDSKFRPIPPGTKRYARTTPVLGWRTYEFELLIRTGFGCQREFIPPI